MFTLPRAAGFAAALCTALALSTPAFALDVQIQEGAAVKFPKGLKWEPMVKTRVEVLRTSGHNFGAEFTQTKEELEKQLIASGTAKPKERERAIAFWNAHSMDATIASWETITNEGSYFVTAAYIYDKNNKCIEVKHNGNGNLHNTVYACESKIAFQSPQDSHSSNISIGNTCMFMGFPPSASEYYESTEDDPEPSIGPFATNRPEVAFDAKTRTFYLRQIVDGEIVKQCNRKITLTP